MGMQVKYHNIIYMNRSELYQPLSNEDVMSKIKCKFMPYSAIHHITSITDLLPTCLLLYQTHPNVGHFCCVFSNHEGINFFDSYGLFPDDQLLKMSNSRRNEIHHDRAYLDMLLYNQSTPVIYNEHQYQSYGTSTCGKWCAIRMDQSNLSNDEFYNVFKCIPTAINRDICVCKLYNML